MVVIIDSQVAGISGDMLLSGLVDMGARKERILDGIYEAINYFNDSKINFIDFKKIVKNGIGATQLHLQMEEGRKERKGTEIQEGIVLASEKIEISDSAKVFARESIRTLINAESKIHLEPIESVHFHEAASLDTVIDILGCAIALDDLNIFLDEIISTPVAVGGGLLNFSHGIVSNPANAILEIFKGNNVGVVGGQAKEELTTPTGASMLVNLTKNFSEFYPLMKIQSVGYGAGEKNFDGFSNVLKIVKGERMNTCQEDSVQILETNIDDVSGEILGNLIEKTMSMGAKDITISPGITKKNRPTNIVSIICEPGQENKIIETLVAETGTLGIRVRSSSRVVVPRFLITVPLDIQGKNFAVKCKIVKIGDTIRQVKTEFSDLKLISESLLMPIRDVDELVRSKVKEKIGAL